MNILIVNDDGYYAPGIKALEECLKKYGDVYVVAPAKSMSGTGTSVSVYNPIKFNKIDEKHYIIDGTPSDCAEFGILMLGVKIDLVLSGINNGLNISQDTLHSGTIGACLEALSLQVPAIALSHNLNLNTAINHLDEVMELILHKNLISNNYVINVNFPNSNDVKGIELAKNVYRNCKRWYDVKNDTVMAKRELDNPNNYDKDSEIYLVYNGYISISLLSKDFSNSEFFEKYKDIIHK